MPSRDRSIYVRIDVRGSIDRLWELTQTPAEHRRWDLRFTDIDYLPRPDPGRPQQFRYATRIGFGLAFRGGGETVGEGASAGGSRASALRFWSDDPKSLIRAGSGYWKYQPRPDGVVRFLTRYDYDVRFGRVGRWFDRLVFRPAIGWATAWSFDRLRLWIERGLDPAVAARLALVYAAARSGVAFVWLYHGVVPKLLLRNADELAMLNDLGWRGGANAACVAAGVVETAFGLIVLFGWRWRWPLWLTLVAMPVATLDVAVFSPRYLSTAFNAVTLNVATTLLATVALLTAGLTPSAMRCTRREREGAA